MAKIRIHNMMFYGFHGVYEYEREQGQKFYIDVEVETRDDKVAETDALSDGVDTAAIYDIVKDVKFETFGCGSAIASSSMATEMIKGKPLSEVRELTNKAVAEALDGLPDYKMHCSVLAEEAIKNALEDYEKRKAEEK